MNQSLESYLNHHLDGFAKALVLLDTLESREETAEDKRYYQSVREEVKGEQNFLRGLIESAGLQESKILDYRELMEGPEGLGIPAIREHATDPLAHLELLETLVLTIQSKRLLWKALEAILPQVSGWRNVDFHILERAAIRQRDGVEARRQHSVHEAFWRLLAEAS